MTPSTLRSIKPTPLTPASSSASIAPITSTPVAYVKANPRKFGAMTASATFNKPTTPLHLPATILVVDDEADLLRLVRYNLLKEGFTVLCAEDGAQAYQLLADNTPDLMILDLMLPDKSGVELCTELKTQAETAKIPIIMLTARSSEQDRIHGFEAGAEDYVVKPFSPKELVLRVKALLIRTRQDAVGKDEGDTQGALTPVSIGPLTLYPNDYRVLVNQQAIPLTQLEFDILQLLVLGPNRVHSREQILEAVWADEAELVLDRTVDAHMKRLRGKLGPHARDLIETVRGVGYRMNVPAEG